MPSLMQLWAPILLAALLVQVTSTLVHMVLKWHNSDYRKLPNEDQVRAAIRAGSPAPGQYIVPHCLDPNEMKQPEVAQKWVEGPVGMMYIIKNGAPSIGPQIGAWAAFNLVIAFFVAYVSSRTLPIGTEYLKVFQVVGAISFLAYAGGQVPAAIWYGKPWSATVKDIIDSLLYGLMTAGAFGWLWPRG
jgi:hypothetical protein